MPSKKYKTYIETQLHLVSTPSNHCMPVVYNPVPLEKPKPNLCGPGHRREGPQQSHGFPQVADTVMPFLTAKHVKGAREGEEAHDVEREPVDVRGDRDGTALGRRNNGFHIFGMNLNVLLVFFHGAV